MSRSIVNKLVNGQLCIKGKEKRFLCEGFKTRWTHVRTCQNSQATPLMLSALSTHML